MSSVYESWNPETLEESLKERYEVTYSGEEGCDSMRDKFKVVCKECDVTVHHSTTHPPSWIDIHEKDHPSARPMTKRSSRSG